MTRSLILASVMALALSGAMATDASAKQCRDSKGKFVACSTTTAAPKQKCKDAHGKYAKCSAPGATAVK